MKPTRPSPTAGLAPAGHCGRSRSGRIGSQAAGWLLASLLLVSCGGGGLGSGGTGAPLAGGSGTITGFGSIVVDGVAIDDRAARVQTEDPNGSLVAVSGELGQRVDVDFDANGVARSVRIDAQLIGPVTGVQPLLGRFTVLGRTVQVNTAATEGPATVLAGVSSVTSLTVGQWVEVHGVDGRTALTDLPLLQATRVRALAAPAPAVRVSGRVETVSGDGSRVTIGTLIADLRAALRVPAGATVATGDRITLLARPQDVAGTAQAPLLTARVLRVLPPATVGARVQLAGKVASLTTERMSVDGVEVLLGTVAPTGDGSLAVGRYVRVDGTTLAPGRVQATAVVVRSGGGSEGDVELKGTVLGVTPDGLGFRVRDTRVVLPAGASVLRDCGSAGVVAGVFVEVKGVVAGEAVLASRVECKLEPSDAVVEREGLAREVDTTARTLRLASLADPQGIRVQWGELTVFRDLQPTTDSLQGRRLEVEGIFRADGVLLARRIKADD